MKFSNAGKLERLQAFIGEYRLLVADIIDHLWEKGYRGDSEKVTQKKESTAEESLDWYFWFDLKKDKYRLPDRKHPAVSRLQDKKEDRGEKEASVRRVVARYLGER